MLYRCKADEHRFSVKDSIQGNTGLFMAAQELFMERMTGERLQVQPAPMQQN